MRKTIDKKTGAILCTLVVLAVLVVYGAVGLIGWAEEQNSPAAITVIVFYFVVILASALGVILALRQRLRELDGKEEEIAKQY